MNYAYAKPNGEIVWHTQGLMDGCPPVEIEVDGVTAKRSYRAERAGVPPTKGWPITCYASGVHADDAQKLRDEFKRVGVPTDVTSEGDPVYRDPGHRKRALKARGFFDRAAFY